MNKVVKVVKIDKVIQHPNADKLTINTVGRIDCVSNLKEDGTPRYKEGDLVVYIPTKAIIPEWLLKKMGMWNEKEGKGYLGGSKGNRVKPITLRGIKSIGMLYPVLFYQDIAMGHDYIDVDGTKYDVSEDIDVTKALGITFQQEEPEALDGNTKGKFTSYSSIDNLKSQIVKLRRTYGKILPVVKAVATEKIHGCLKDDTLITTKEFGDIPIKEIIENDLDCSVLTKNIETNKNEWNKVLNKWTKEDNTKSWYKITLDDGTEIVLTGNHKIYIPTNNDYIEAKDTKVGDILLKR